ncbi:uncharacterized protein [Venturia canescens]|uniref:uncharacterized protein isoform X1 n=1 Tax=Venturia canescens TaxID=32260 RepID=UPI001C9D00CE|nr:uncharacterized protein LOC122411105 isoform X1 [Venturia canescens]XP_043277748.1 uncharacterized protein LOC122412342 isoform X1 [Venturia canescens]
MPKYALLLGSDDAYYVRKTSFLRHHSGLTYEIKKQRLMTKLICFHAKRKVLVELRNNLVSSRPSLELSPAEITSQPVNNEVSNINETRSNGEPVAIGEESIDPGPMICDFTSRDNEIESDFLGNVGIDTFINDQLGFNEADELQRCDSPEYPDKSEKNACEDEQNDSSRTESMKSVEQKEITRTTAKQPQFLEKSKSNEEIENNYSTISENNSFVDDETDFNKENELNISQTRHWPKNYCESVHNDSRSSDENNTDDVQMDSLEAREGNEPNTPQPDDLSISNSEFDENFPSRAEVDARPNVTENRFPRTVSSDSEYNPDSDLDGVSTDSENNENVHDELMNTASTKETADDSLDSTTKQTNVSNDLEKSREAPIDQNFPFNVAGTSACNLGSLKTELSRGPKGDNKKNVCLYCQKPQSKIARHLELVHGNETKVKEFISLPPNNKQRKMLIGLIRKKGNFINIDRKRNNDGLIVPVRRPRDPTKCSGEYYRPCPKCLGMFSKNNIRHHLCQSDVTTTKGIMLEARRVAGQVHPEASKKMRQEILPRLQDGPVSNAVKFDKLIVLYGNDMSSRHRKQYLESMVRSELRLLGRFLLVMKKLDNTIVDLTSVFDPKYWKQMLKALDIMGKLDPKKNIYETPTVPFQLQITLRKVCDVLIRETIQDHEEVKKKNAKDMLKLMNQGFVNTVNKTVTESQVELRRQKSTKLPLTSDIEKLSTYLEAKMDDYSKLLQQSFSSENWRTLAEVTLISMLVYNRRRPGELERMLKLDYGNLQGINEDDEEYQQLSRQGQTSAHEYARLEIRGKLNRTVPVLLDQRMKKCTDLILKYSKRAGVGSKNPHVFGIPSQDKHRFPFLRATILLRRFATDCGAKKPELLRATNLRKHMATKCANMNLASKETNKVAHFLGHNPNIHTNVYQQRKTSDIVVMSNFLKTAQGRPSTLADEKSLDYSTGLDTTADTNILSSTVVNTDMINEAATNDSNDSTDYEVPVVSDITVNNKRTPKRKRKKGEPAKHAPQKRRSNQKKRWSEEEIAAVSKHFKKYLQSGTLPSMSLIKQFQKINNTLNERKPATIKVWLHNQIKKNRPGILGGEITASEESD